MTPRDRQVLKLIADGCTNQEIATRLHLGTQTVKNRVSVLMEKVGARNRVQLAVYVVRTGLI
ncbi:MAG TPA: LuxR C-terminal-related transcriptional regulator [Vicinamibacterales bacterium]|nr:LuxR C-terminal-related transcriptional regulator [Vicinamibacterales bacterium]